MSWLARSIADSLRINDNDEDEDEGEEDVENGDSANPWQSQSETEGNDKDVEEEEDEEDRIGRGVREDLTEFRESLTRQLWGVASFLAPPPAPPPPPPPLTTPFRQRTWRVEADRYDSGDVSPEELSDSVGVSKNLELYGDGFGVVRSNISADQAASGLSKLDSNQFEFEEEDRIGDAVGITEEVLAFAINIAHHPETWLDFPLEEEDDNDDFDLSDAQYKHVLAIQHFTPRLAALRIELCPAHMSVSYFWKVYFVLLYSRLNRQDAEALSTPQLVTARAMWMQELQKRTKKETDWFRSSSYQKGNAKSWNESFDHMTDEDDFKTPGNTRPRTFGFEPATYPVMPEFETLKHPIVNTELQIIDKVIIEEEPVIKTRDKDLATSSSFKLPIQNYEEDDDDDDWLNDNPELEGYIGTSILLGNEEDVSFSDLEDDDDCSIPVKSKVFRIGMDVSSKSS